MKKEKCDKCKGKGMITLPRKYVHFPPGKTVCVNCWGQGFRMVKTERELVKEFRDEQDALNAQCRL